MSTIIISVVVVAVIGVALYYTLKNRKKGCCSYCSCSSCGGCSLSTNINEKKANKDK
ncbi:MAG: FeoB-associated Cys-rich membrane protein [Clostridiales bacterium]|jgi:hypothetical protein|nr:FeoB-associated Cys-rich membrane protein [Clostridiales bacterium]